MDLDVITCVFPLGEIGQESLDWVGRGEGPADELVDAGMDVVLVLLREAGQAVQDSREDYRYLYS